MPRVARECRVITKEPEPCDARRWRSDALYVETALARNDHHAADWRRAAETREALRPRWKHKEPVPRKEGRLH